MSLEIGNSFGLTCRVLRIQCESSQVNQWAAVGLEDLLKCLTAMEKLLISKYFCQIPLNVGSFRVLRKMQQMGILTATEYVCSIEDEEQLQLILIEFLENQHDLLCNLFIAAQFDSLNSTRLSNMLEKILRNVFNALAENPKISNLNYVEPLSKTLPDEVLINVCFQMHLNILLELNEVEDVSLAFQHFSSWINEGVDELTFVKCITGKLLVKHQQEVLNYLFKLSTATNFKQWKYYLIMVQSIASSSNAETMVFIKKYLKSRLQQVASLGCQLSLLHLLLTARAAAATTIDIQQNLDNYAQWYKQNIGEMSYLLGNEQFQVVLNILDDSVHYEQEIDYIEIHAAIAISPGGKLVQAYKNKCKAHLSRLKAARK